MEQDRRLELIDHAIQVQGSLHNNDAQYQNALSHLFSVSQVRIIIVYLQFMHIDIVMQKLVPNFILTYGVCLLYISF